MQPGGKQNMGLNLKLKLIDGYQRLEAELQVQKALLKANASNDKGEEIGSVITKSAVTFAIGLLIISAVWGSLELTEGDAFYNISSTLSSNIGTAFKIGIIGVVVIGARFIMNQLNWF